MDYILEANNNRDTKLLKLQDDGTYRTIGIVWNVDDGKELVQATRQNQ